jgi:hypothetical protein
MKKVCDEVWWNKIACWKIIMWNNDFAMIETIIDKCKIIERKRKQR